MKKPVKKPTFKIERQSLIQILLAVGSGILLALSFPMAKGITLTPIAWVALVPLLIALRKASSKRAFWLGMLAGFIANFGIFYWIPYCMIIYASMSKLIAYFALVLLALLLASYIAVFFWLVKLAEQHFKLSLLIIAPILWVALEYVRTYFPLGGFPWALVGTAQYKFLPVIQIADIGGVYLVSGLIVLVNSGIAVVLKKPVQKKSLMEFAISLLIFASAIIYGEIRIRQVDRVFSKQPEIKVGIVQGNIDQGVKWNPFYFWSSMSRHIAISNSLLKEPKDLLLWPEAAITDYFNLSWEHKEESDVVKKISDFDSYFLFGSLSRGYEGDKKINFNSAYLLSPFAQEMIGRYDKMHLVPFGEYVPMQKILFWVDAIAGGNTGNTSPGKAVTVFETPRFKISCVICYELIFPNLTRKFTKAGAEIMSTITNDAWFGPTSAPYQHNSNIALRSVENRVYFLRAANTGISSICDPAGRILKQTEIFEIAALEGVVKPSPIRTIYSRYGDWFPILCAVLTMLMIAVILVKGFWDKIRRKQ